MWLLVTALEAGAARAADSADAIIQHDSVPGHIMEPLLSKQWTWAQILVSHHNNTAECAHFMSII